MDYMPKRIYTKLEPHEIVTLVKLAQKRSGELRDPRKLASALLSQAIEMEAAGKTYCITVHNYANDDTVEPSE